MNKRVKHVENCGCEHHTQGTEHTHHVDEKCPTDIFVDILIESLKKDF